MPIEKKFKGENILPIADHPGSILLEYLDSKSVGDIQKVLQCSEEYLHKIYSRDPNYGLSRIMCLRLAHYFDTSFEFWYNIQKQYDHAYILAHETTLVADLVEK